MNRAERLRQRIEQREQLRGRAAPVVTQRTPNSITQRLEDGRNVTQVSIGPIHYERGGELREIDTRFRERSGSEFEDAIEDAPYHAEVRNDGTRRIWPRAEREDEYIEWGRLEEWDRIRWRVVATVRRGRGDNTLTFGSHRRQLRITARPDGLKADLWLDSASDAGQYRFPYTLHGLTRDGSALVSERDGTVVGRISPITIIDAEGEAHAVEHTITDDAVEVTGDYSELAFPLSIDPSTSIGIAAGADDGTFGAINSGNTYFAPTNNNVELGSLGGRSGWFRFTNLPIPRGGAITNSYILFHWAAGTSRSWDNQFRIRAHSTDDAVAPVDWSHISQMQRTQSTVIWNTAGTGPAIRGEPIETVDCSPVVEEVVTREGWNAGNSILLFIEDSPSGNNRTVASIEHPDNNPAILSIEWEGPPVPDPPTGLTLNATGPNSIAVTWNEPD